MHVYFGDTNIPDGEALARELPGYACLPPPSLPHTNPP